MDRPWHIYIIVVGWLIASVWFCFRLRVKRGPFRRVHLVGALSFGGMAVVYLLLTNVGCKPFAVGVGLLGWLMIAVTLANRLSVDRGRT